MRVILHVVYFFVIVTFAFAETKAKHWAWQPLESPSIPKIKEHQHPIDAFILHRLGSTDLDFSPEASRRTLIRRLTFNLTGLPPTSKEIETFLTDTSSDAYEKLVDRLLSSTAYGEHWAQHWLDLARFAETDGFEHDKIRPNAWRYRDWVIKALNEDRPYNQFVQLQIAGDQLRPDDPQAAIATGFLLAGQDMPDINLQTERRHMVLNEMTSVVGSTFLGLTLGCAQCHDHKYDPISQKEFYQMRAFFESDLQLKERKLGKLTARVMHSGKPLKTHLSVRGDFRRQGEVVSAGYPVIASPAGLKPKQGQRRELATWLTRPDNALAMRVMANRLWQQHFGLPLVAPEDFGTQGETPTHPRLLDWLAIELPRRKWSLKSMHKLIVTSATWRQASRNTPADQNWKNRLSQDPENKLWSRQSRRRLTGEMLRDTMLAANGSLSGRKGGPGVRPPLPKEITVTLLKNQWPVSAKVEDHRRRSIYLFARRNLRLPMFDLFDRPPQAETCARRRNSTTAPQSLALLNSEFTRDAAARLARVAADKASSQPAQFTYCYSHLLNRDPTPGELESCAQLVEATTDPKQGLSELCLALMNLNEFLYID